MKTVTTEYVRELIDFAPTDEQKSKGFAETQLEGTVALFNMLSRNSCAYLADEVGMGKTYIALGVMSLLRHFEPHARIVVIAPRENIQRKWVKELHNFVRINWKVTGNRVKGIQGGPTWEPVLCSSLLDFAHESLLNADRDFFLRMTSFSVASKDPERRKKLRRQLLRLVPWLGKRAIQLRDEDLFKEQYASAINAAIHKADLVIVDEAHNLKHGFGPRVSTRNRVMALTYGHPTARARELPWYGSRAKRILFLSATPFEDDYAAVRRQFEIFGFGDIVLKNAQGKEPLKISTLDDNDASLAEKRAVVSRVMLRRVTQLRIANEPYTKNMYRREWRMGGYGAHDEPMAIEDPKQRLVIALMQKKVAEVLQDERFNNHFQIGMLSSFESFLESVRTAEKSKQKHDESRDEEPVFDGDQAVTDSERAGIDTDAISTVVDSYRKRFGTGLPHPKLDSTADAWSTAFETGDKALLFVRRVATVNELAAKLDAHFDGWIRNRMEVALPNIAGEIDELFSDYEKDRMRRPEEQFEIEKTDADEVDDEEYLESLTYLDEEDLGSAETFFAWFFRGQGPKGYLSGAAFQKSRLASASAVYSTLFEEDHVSWLLGRPQNPIDELAVVLGQSKAKMTQRLRALAYSQFSKRKQQKDRYPRLYVFEAYQIAALELLAEIDGDLGDKAKVVLAERYPGTVAQEVEPKKGFPEPEEAIGATTFFTELISRPELREKLWPDEPKPSSDFRQRFRRREQRRELISAMARLGAAYIDLYLLAIRDIGSFITAKRTEGKMAERSLAGDYADLLNAQMHQDGFHAYYELFSAAQAFDLILATNFPQVPAVGLPELAKLYGATLQRQSPVGRMAGGVNKRLVRQFRMPGFPLVLVTTDVLQEGEDLHTFCRNIVHYGIAWTPSAMEQRTGRIDRIGSLVQRQIDGRDETPFGAQLLQVYYPHMRDTVEVLQVRRVLKRLNRFLSLIHKQDKGDHDMGSRLDTAHEMLEELTAIPVVDGVLESAFPTREEWLEGRLGKSDLILPNLTQHKEHFDLLWDEVLSQYGIEEFRTSVVLMKEGWVSIDEESENYLLSSELTGRRQHFRLELRSQVSGDAVLLRCISDVGVIDHSDIDTMKSLWDLQSELGGAKFCIRSSTRKYEDHLTTEGDILFHPDTTQYSELEDLLERTVLSASYASDMLNSSWDTLG